MVNDMFYMGLNMRNVKLNIFRLIKELEIKTSQDLYWTDIAKKSGITRQTWDRLYAGRADGIDLRTLGKLLDFFESEGVSITISDLFTVTGEQ